MWLGRRDAFPDRHYNMRWLTFSWKPSQSSRWRQWSKPDEFRGHLSTFSDEPLWRHQKHSRMMTSRHSIHLLSDDSRHIAELRWFNDYLTDEGSHTEEWWRHDDCSFLLRDDASHHGMRCITENRNFQRRTTNKDPSQLELTVFKYQSGHSRDSKQQKKQILQMNAN